MELMLDAARKRQLADELRHRLERKIDLPVMPEVGHELLMLRNSRAPDVGSLVNIIAKDPVIAANLLRYSRMSSFGYGDRIQSLDEAISLVLGYDKAMHLAMGLSVGRSMGVEIEGPLGLRAFWQRSLSCAVLTQSLAKELAPEYRVSEGLSYLAGLLHDIGFLVFGCLYPDEFAELNRIVSNYEWIEMRELEFHCIGISHDLIGSRLLRIWNMPDEIVRAAGEHHFPDYDGEYAIYPKLVYLADSLMRMQDSTSMIDKPWLKFEKLGLDGAAVQRALEKLDDFQAELEPMVEGLLQVA